MSERDEPLVDFDAVPRALRLAVGLITVGVLVGAVVDGLLRGLTFQTLGRWAGIYVVVLVLVAAVVTAVHALRGAGRAGSRGERLTSDDVGLLPRRRPEEDGG